MVILNVNLEVPGEILDPLTQQSNLHFRRAGIRLMKPELLYNPLFLSLSNPHVSPLFYSLSFFSCIFSNILMWGCKAANFKETAETQGLLVLS